MIVITTINIIIIIISIMPNQTIAVITIIIAVSNNI